MHEWDVEGKEARFPLVLQGEGLHDTEPQLSLKVAPADEKLGRDSQDRDQGLCRLPPHVHPSKRAPKLSPMRGGEGE